MTDLSIEELHDRLKKGCEGKPRSQKGLNVKDFKSLCVHHKIDCSNIIGRKEFEKKVCKKLLKTKSPKSSIASVSTSVSSSESGASLPFQSKPKAVSKAALKTKMSVAIKKPVIRGTQCNGRTDDYVFITDTGSVSTLSYLCKDDYIDHKIYEQGTAGDCFYCCYAAAINQLNRLNKNPVRISMKDLRDIISQEMVKLRQKGADDILKMLYFSETDEFSDDIEKVTDYLVRKSNALSPDSTRRQGGTFDANILSNIFNIGVIFISVIDGSVLCTDSWNKEYYTLILWDTTKRHINDMTPNGSNVNLRSLSIGNLNHYRSIGIRPHGYSGKYMYIVPCDLVPDSIKVRSSVCETSIGCP